VIEKNKMISKKTLSKRLNEDKWYLLFILPAIVLLFFFVYRPMYGLLMAFQNYKIGNQILAFDGSINWVGLDHFKRFITSIFFPRIMGNTLRLSILTLVFGCWVPLAVALLLNEIRIRPVKRTMQTVYYLPYFISSAVVVSIITLMFNANGPIAALNVVMGNEAVNFLNDSKYFDAIYVGSGIWQSFGYGSIIYMAAISGVDPALHEAVMIDGGNRWHRMRHVTMPHVMPTFIIILIMSIGGLLGSNTEKILLMYNTYTMDQADVIGTYVYRVGLLGAQYSYSTAVGLFINSVNFLMVFGANWLSRKLTDYSLW